MSLSTYVQTGLISYLLVILTVCRIRGLNWMDTIILAVCGIIGGNILVSLIETEAGSIAWHYFPMMCLGSAGITAVFVAPKKIVPVVHEGEVTLGFISFLYMAQDLTRENRELLLYLAAPLALWLVFEILSWVRPSEFGRFMLAVIFSFSCGAICVYQLHRGYELLGWRPNIPMSTGAFLLRSFMAQFTIFWAALHCFRLINILPFFGERKKYRNRLRKETIPEMAASIAPYNVDFFAILFAVIFHVLPILGNLEKRWVEPSLMLSYSVLVSPAIVDFIYGVFKVVDPEPMVAAQIPRGRRRQSEFNRRAS